MLIYSIYFTYMSSLWFHYFSYKICDFIRFSYFFLIQNKNRSCNSNKSRLKFLSDVAVDLRRVFMVFMKCCVTFATSMKIKKYFPAKVNWKFMFDIIFHLSREGLLLDIWRILHDWLEVINKKNLPHHLHTFAKKYYCEGENPRVFSRSIDDSSQYLNIFWHLILFFTHKKWKFITVPNKHRER